VTMKRTPACWRPARTKRTKLPESIPATFSRPLKE
jgi:hypothetical protein